MIKWGVDMHKAIYKNNKLTVYDFVQECKSKGFTKYIFKCNKEGKIGVLFTFNDVKYLYYSNYDVLYLGDKDNHIDLHNVYYIKSVCDLDVANVYKVVCSTNKHSRQRKHNKAFVCYEITATKL